MAGTRTDTDILIVGAGPVGLFLANECARRGLRWRLVETRSTQSEHSKALAIMPRTLEIFDMAGIADAFIETANRVVWAAVVEPRRRLARIRFSPERTPYPFVAMVPQDVTEKLLVEALQRKGGAVEYETAFVRAAQSADSVSFVLERQGQRLEGTAAFVVGCDGAHSTVRHLVNLPFEGAEYEASFMLADAETNDALPADEMQLCPSASGPLAIFPMSAFRRRIVATVREPEEDAPSLELVRKVLAERGPRGMEARSLHWSSYFRIHHRQVKSLRVGRIFIAGDAAHIHSPFGGQGINTGLQDVWNLAWKLDFVLRGHGGEQLLDSYSSERLPVIRHVIEATDFMTRAMGAPSKFAQALRDATGMMVSRVAPLQHAFVQLLSELGVAYTGSLIVDGSGERYFDEPLRGGKGICRRFVMILGTDLDKDFSDDAQRLVDSFDGASELRRGPGHGLILVRPDGYIAYSSRDGNPAALAGVRSLLERLTS